MKNTKTIILVILISVVAGGILGYFISTSSHQHINTSDNQQIEESVPEVWTCSMHPSVRQNEPGDCPICGMDLIPLDESNSDVLSPDAVSMSATAMQLAQVSTAKVQRKSIEKDIRVTGKIQANEKQNYSLSAHFPGRIENLRLNYTGEYVRKGQVIATLYSPDLLTAQEELLQAYNDREMQPSLFEAAIEKLKNWKLNDAQIEKIIDLGRPREQFEIMADFSGYVTEKKVKEGDYVQKGQSLFQLNNFSKVWVVFDVYEQDIPFVELGSKVDFKIASFPNEEFSGKIDFINPTLSAQSRVAEARADIQNTDGKLKPEMLVSGQINYENQARSVVVIPKSAVMWTGKKSVVYVQEHTEKGISFVMRGIDLGLPLNDEYVIESGLAEGEEIAVQGAFSIDAAAQLAGKPSMMSAERQDDFAVEISDEAQAELRRLYPSYFQLKEALTKDDFQSALARAKELKSVYQKIDMQAFQDDVHDKWMGYHAKMEKVLEHIHHHDDIESLRKNFIALSDWMIEMTETFSPTREKLYLQHCPMADNDQGADWLSMEEEIVNPYFGSSMLTCGEVEKVIN
ncbi:efflux RND transporter periplasmic adaptor subunit [Marivirga harenae]|uniref:efflux RND transporter periplasmic adaptor subunit n=1 Tax=Marivirga harenae TaxID=2010992 RepID=UPI0026E0657B|nr:efflux RND transporter periplasmic adaptor subunit [Marivirga harenae]WKV13920.1 efflux RND transporter periplasmic adaptor subunit [Marivirga harenae]|tara:strand:+ start:233229 stop:234941 length:1713 start_codon:yes stop_codon:yes gene_type:complete